MKKLKPLELEMFESFDTQYKTLTVRDTVTNPEILESLGSVYNN